MITRRIGLKNFQVDGRVWKLNRNQEIQKKYRASFIDLFLDMTNPYGPKAIVVNVITNK